MKTAGLLCMSVLAGMALNGNQTVRGENELFETNAAVTDTTAVYGNPGPPAAALPGGIEPDSALAELVRLVQAGVEKSVMLAYIENTLRLFELDADGIIYLTDLGAPAEVITAAMEHDQELIQKGISPETASTESVSPVEAAVDLDGQPQEVTTNVFYDTLSPYGVWVNIDGYGRCWRPSVIIYNVTWHPYCDDGRWIYTDCGWYWKSYYSWGWATFHYGRWFRHARYGWCWWPDTVWAPSWVCWRYDRSYCGWAPLPPYTYYRSGFGIVYRGSRVSAGFDFGLNAGAFTFVAARDFCDPQPRNCRVDNGEASRIYKRTTAFHEISFDRQHQRVSNAGIPHRDIATAARQDIRPVSIHQLEDRGARGRQDERIEERGPAVNRPGPASFNQTSPSTARSGNPPSGRRPQYGGSASGSSREQDGYGNRTSQPPQAHQRKTPYIPPGNNAYEQPGTPRRNSANSASQQRDYNNRSSSPQDMNRSYRSQQSAPPPQAHQRQPDHYPANAPRQTNLIHRNG